MSTAYEEIRYEVPIEQDRLAAVATVVTAPGPRRLALLVHGGPGGQKDGPEQLYVHLADELAQAGISSVRFDFRGCGQSTGNYRDMTMARQAAELTAVRRFVDAELAPDVVALVGESYGATIGILDLGAGYAAHVWLWPCVWLLDGAFESFVTPEKLRSAEAEGHIVEDGEEIGLAFLEELLEVGDVAEPLRRFGSVPTLFVHGEADSEVPFAQSARAAELLSGPVRLVPVPDGDHCLEEPHERQIVNRETAAWLREHM
ncbi:alpha/beta hydrolase family protein [Streptomyces sp. NPDC008313]|uniref:alpha/beta hydrolase family protein n=1 Tax=Streptomyces sp. NPDC008313 TaxID=3364826 RepID=UPI0036F033B4